MRKIALVVAVENYRNPKISRVQFASADAISIADVLRLHGFEIPDSALLIDSDATKTTIESRLRIILGGLQRNDVFFLFYAGHGFARNDTNYITCYDTELGDLTHTSIPLQSVFRALRESQSTRLAMFLDACETGLPADASARGILAHMNDVELQDFFGNSEFCVCFASCKTDESSWSSGSLKHGIWTHHLLRALSGEAPEALSRGRYLTSDSLQNFLATEVPRTIRATFNTPRVQTPWYYGAKSREFVVADLSEILERRAQTSTAGVAPLVHAILSGEEHKDIKRLSGFNPRYHFVPSDVTSKTEAFAITAAEDDLEEEVETLFQSIRDHFGYKRRDLKQTIGRGEATIITPDFDVHITVRQDRGEPWRVIWRRVVTNFQTPTILFTDEFDAVFADLLDTVELHSTKQIGVEQLIDHLEDMENDDVSVDFPSDASWVEVKIAGIRDTFRITERSMIFTAPYVKQPRLLLERFTEMHRALVTFQPVAAILIAAESPNEEIETRKALPARLRQAGEE